MLESIREAEHSYRDAAEQEEKAHACKRAKEFRAWAKRSTECSATAAYKYAMKPSGWKPEGTWTSEGTFFSEENVLRDQASKWSQVWRGDAEVFPP